MNDFVLHQLVTEPTRLTNTLDLVLTNFPDKTKDTEVTAGIPGSDHNAIRFNIACSIIRYKPPPTTLYNFKKANFDAFREALSKIQWVSCFLTDSIEDAWCNFKDLFFLAADQSIPRIPLRRNRKHFTWLSDETLKMIKRKKRAFRKSKKTCKEEDIRKYKDISNAVRSLTRRDHNSHLEDITSNLTTNPKRFWNWIKSFRGGSTTIPQLQYLGLTHRTATERANALNRYFTSVFTHKTTYGIEELADSLKLTRSKELIELPHITEEVCHPLNKIDVQKSSSPDGIPGRLLREGAPWIVQPLSTLFNLSLKSGTLPTDWRSSNITPIFKKGSKHTPSNYRPVSLTCITIKILEQLVHKRIGDFLNKHNKLSPQQHGFRANHSCQTQLLEAVHQWCEALNHRSSTHLVFLDFAKAFDSVPHCRLCLKLDNIGIRSPLLTWIKAFLTNRHQRVVVDGSFSTWAPVISGVPQGSVLGPLLFLIYINDIGDNLASTTKLFADDCALYREVNNAGDAQILQSDINHLLFWLQRWQLPLNVSKCKVMNISNKKTNSPTTYFLNAIRLEWVDTFKYLGVVIDCKLKWGDQINHSTFKATKILNLIKRNLAGCSNTAKNRVYLALLDSTLIYQSSTSLYLTLHYSTIALLDST